MNLREEFSANYALIRQKKFEEHFSNTHREIEAPFCTWFGRSEEFISIMLQRAIVGVESYLPSAVSFSAAMQNKVEIVKHEAIKDPFVLKGRGTAENLYNRLPALLDPNLSLKHCNPQLWEMTKQFYREVRNPLFHGSELDAKKGEFRAIRASFKHVKDLYGWIDGWFSMKQLVDWVVKTHEPPPNQTKKTGSTLKLKYAMPRRRTPNN